MKSFEVKNYIKEFIYILIKELHHKLSQNKHEQKRDFAFSDLILSDILFYQIFPRYPMCYTFKDKENVPAAVNIFLKMIQLHWGYISFFEPLIFNSFFHIENDEKKV